MNPQYRRAILIGMVFVLMTPYLGFVIYYWRQFPSNQWPTWFTNTIAAWFIANFVVLMLLMRLTARIFGNQVVDVGKARVLADRAIRTNTRLVIFWTLFFLYGVVKAVQGKVPVGARNSGRGFPVVFHRDLRLERIPCETGKGLSRKPPS